MKKIFIILLSAISLVAFSQQKTVAVYVAGDQTGISKVLGDQLVAAFVKNGKYRAIERTNSFLSELSKEQDYQRSGAVTDNQIAKLGQQFGVQLVCVAEVSEVFEEKWVSARLIDVESAEIVNTHSAGGAINNLQQCISIANEIAGHLGEGSLVEKKQAEAKVAQQLSKMEDSGYMDLGLPSGTLWKKSPEPIEPCEYDEISADLKASLPTILQMNELLNYCEWKRIGTGFVVTGPNGNSINFPETGFYKDAGKLHYTGHYHTATKKTNLVFYESTNKPYLDSWKYDAAIRLVAKP